MSIKVATDPDLAESWAAWIDIRSLLWARIGACLVLRVGAPAVLGTREYSFGTSESTCDEVDAIESDKLRLTTVIEWSALHALMLPGHTRTIDGTWERGVILARRCPIGVVNPT